MQKQILYTVIGVGSVVGMFLFQTNIENKILNKKEIDIFELINENIKSLSFNSNDKNSVNKK